MKTYKVELVRENNKRETVLTLAPDQRTAEMVAPDYLKYKAREPKALPISAKEI